MHFFVAVNERKKVTEIFGQHLFMVIEIQRKDEKFWTNVEAVTRIIPRSWAIIKFSRALCLLTYATSTIKFTLFDCEAIELHVN